MRAIGTKCGPRVCDRCHKLKEKCEWINTSDSCGRCARLGFECTKLRPLQRMGRRPLRQRTLSNVRPRACSVSQQSSEITPRLTDQWQFANNRSPSLPMQLDFLINDSVELETMYRVLNSRDLLEYYIIGPSFYESEQQSLLKMLEYALPVLKDAYMACTGSLLLTCNYQSPGMNKEANLRRASSALTLLRALPVTNYDEATVCLTLSFCLITFGYSALGSNTTNICRYCLDMIKPFFFESTPPGLDMLPFIVCLVVSEYIECLMRREVPTVRFVLQQPEYVDRYIGLCCPLLPYLYDVCEISHSLLEAGRDETFALFARLAEIEFTLKEWEPEPPAHFLSQYTTDETVDMLAQAKVYRLAIMLSIYRLRYPFTTQDSRASEMSREILGEFHLAKKLTRKAMRNTTFPFAVAAVELTDPDERAQALLDAHEFVEPWAPAVQERMKVYLSSIWNARDNCEPFYLFDWNSNLTLDSNCLMA